MKNKNLIKENVLKLVQQYPETAISYNRLVTYYWRHIHNATTDEDLDMCPSSESITREFRELLKHGEIMLDEKSQRIRREKQLAYRQRFAKAN